MNYIDIPDSELRLTDGSIVILARFPGTRWLVRNGWYAYQGQQCYGWYFCSIPAQTILPLTDSDLRLLTLVSSNSGDAIGQNTCPCNPSSFPVPMPPIPVPPPGPGPGPGPGPIPTSSRNWITVDSINDRNRISKMKEVPDGKVVKVNNTKDGPKYYSWDEASQTWVEETFGIDLTDYVTQAEADQRYVNSDAVSTMIADAVQQLVDVPSQIIEALQSDPTVQQTLKTEVNDALEASDLSERISAAEADILQIKTDIDWTNISDD